MSFADLGLSPETLQAVAEAGYTKPTPIQEQAIPYVLMGRDVLGIAQTGTGKTASFTLPMIDILAAGRAKARMPRSVILCPTRELAAQVAENFEKYGKYQKLSMALLIGGESMNDQIAALDRGVDVLIATPGRLMDMFERGRILLNDVKVLVIDEADRMLDMGFIPDVEKIVSYLPKLRQTLFFSATMMPDIRRLADAFLMNPKQVTVSPPQSPTELVTQGLILTEEIDKRESLRHLLRTENVRNALIFCNRKRDVDVLWRSLEKHGFSVARLHGDMTQSSRGETLDKFKANDVTILVCSDVAARGLDIKELSHVFNFDVPIHAEDYVHRIGRTGRAGREGRAFTIATPAEGRFVQAIEQMMGRPIPRLTLEGIPELSFEDGDSRRRRPIKKGKDGRPERPERRGERPERPQRERAPRVESAEQPEVAERPERVERPARPARPERPARPAPVDIRPAERVEQPDYVEALPERAEPRPERLDRGDGRGERPDRGERGGRRDFAGGGGARPRRDRDRRREIDDVGVGEMRHADKVVGFGDHVPDFMMHAVMLPKKSADMIGDEDEEE